MRGLAGGRQGRERPASTAADNYTYVLICCAGLLMSRYDRVRIDGLWDRSPTQRPE